MTYELELPTSLKVHPVFHASLLFPKPVDEYNREPRQLPPVVTKDGEEEYEVEQILDSRTKGKRVEYYVKWKGYGPEENTWEPIAHLTNSPDLLQAYFRKHPDAPGS